MIILIKYIYYWRVYLFSKCQLFSLFLQNEEKSLKQSVFQTEHLLTSVLLIWQKLEQDKIIV